MIETIAIAFSTSGAAGFLGPPRNRERHVLPYFYQSGPAPRVELPTFEVTTTADVRYPTLEEQEIMRLALWKSAKIIRRSPPIQR